MSMREGMSEEPRRDGNGKEGIRREECKRGEELRSDRREDVRKRRKRK